MRPPPIRHLTETSTHPESCGESMFVTSTATPWRLQIADHGQRNPMRIPACLPILLVLASCAPVPGKNSCSNNSDCVNGRQCVDGQCREPLDTLGPSDGGPTGLLEDAGGGRNQPCRSDDSCADGLICISDLDSIIHVCRLRCDTDPASCAVCGEGWSCIHLNGAAPEMGACLPAAREGEECISKGCSSCLVCSGMTGVDGSASRCRRPCLPDVDAGVPDAAPTGTWEYCMEPTSDGGEVMRNCCPYGQSCLSFLGGGGAACY